MRHNKALKAVARKRLKVIYAIMRDRAPYRAAQPAIETTRGKRPPAGRAAA